jgi:hypothetical protein
MSRPRWPDSHNPLSEIPGTVQSGHVRASSDDTSSIVEPSIKADQAQSAALRGSIASFYDDRLLAEAARWNFKPATKGGKPVKFRKSIQINFEKP